MIPDLTPPRPREMPVPIIDVELVRRLVAGQFPQWAHLDVAPVEFDGWDNRTFRLGTKLTVRVPSGEWYALQVAKEQRWLPWLAPQLPLPIPTPVAQGEPAEGYPYAWSVYRWLPGRNASTNTVADLTEFATDLAGFLTALQVVDASHGPPPGPQNFFRGGPVATYADDTERAIRTLGSEIDGPAATAVWQHALAAAWTDPPVWLHGDVAVGNLLVRHGRLAAVIDFGTSGVGDPACDLVIAWTFFSGACRSAFRRAIDADADTWARARGWLLWKAVITLAAAMQSSNGSVAAKARREISDVLSDAVAAGLA